VNGGCCDIAKNGQQPLGFTNNRLVLEENAEDDAVPSSHPHRVFAGATMADKTDATIPKVSHITAASPSSWQRQ
jgi:hypothetical protein